MKKLKEQYMELADADPGVALLMLVAMVGMLGLGLIITFVFGGSYNWMWEVWAWRLVMLSVLFLIEWGIWKTVMGTYRI